MKHHLTSGTRAACALILLGIVGCDDDPIRPGSGDPREYAAVVNSVSASVTVFPVDEPDSTRAIALEPTSSPTSIDVRGSIALVPLGLFPAVAVIDLEEGVVIDEIPLPAGSGATGVVIMDDSLAFVANPLLNTVTPILYRTGTTLASIEVGVYPTSLLAIGDRVFVIEANLDLDTFSPAGPSTISVIDAEALEVVDDFALTGRNAAQAATDGQRLFVVNAGNFDSANASISIVEPPILGESSHHPGFGSFASEIVSLNNGTLIVASPVYGLAQLDANFLTIIVEPGEGFGAGGANLLGIGVDSSQRIWVLDAGDCASPGQALRITSAQGVVTGEAEVEVCPDAIGFGTF